MLKERVLQSIHTELANELNVFEVEMNRVLENDDITTQDKVDNIKLLLQQISSKQGAMKLFTSYFMQKEEQEELKKKEE